MWGRFRRKEQDVSALQKVLGRCRRSTGATRRRGEVIVVYGNAVRLGFVVLPILATILLTRWLLRRRTREEEAAFTTVWRPGSGAQWVRWGMSDDEFKAQDTTYFAQGLRITSLTSENGKYAAVWQPGSGTQWWSSRRCVVDFRTEDAAYFQRGLRIACLDLQDDPVGAYRYPWQGDVSYTVGQGNNSLPSGSHNGSQAWAFDFSLPAGTQIRAAREGTVEWLQENLTATYNPNQPSGPGNMPFPAGSLQNWGNAVRL